METLHRRSVLPTAVLARQTVLALGALIAIPLLFYPKRLGLPSFELTPVVSLIEWIFYVGVFALAGSRLPGSTRVVAAGFTVVCRLGLGMVLGTFVAWTHTKPWGRTVAETMWSYPLSLILHVLLVPIVMRPVWERVWSVSTVRPRGRRRTVGLVTSRARPTRPARHAYGSRTAAPIRSAGVTGSTPSGTYATEPSLDSAAAYVGEYHGVRMCWIVDREGLPLAVWQRQQYSTDADFWAPISIEAVDFHVRRLSLVEACRPERFEIRTDQGRLITEAVGEFWLGVLTDPEADDLIGVRLSRAREMITTYLRESGRRYTHAGEAEYV
ncbi:MAG TPA: hypothetical protein VM118_14655 [Acidobacteriota bacterium]|nr:hypothetical protein [Acidobacteriota bacterium]